MDYHFLGKYLGCLFYPIMCNYIEYFLDILLVRSLLLRGPFPSCREWGLLSLCGAQASHCGGFSCCGVWALDTDTVGMGPGFSCPMVCGMLAP